MEYIDQTGTPVSEETLIRRAAENNYQAYEQLYTLHAGRVFALCLRLCGDREMAEDLTQDAFVQAWRKLAGFRGDSAFGSWLYRIATNVTLSYLRKQRPFRDNLNIDEIPDACHADNTDEQLGLEAAIHRLPDGARSVFVLYCLEGYTHEEIAGMLKIATGSSKAHLHRARQLLKDHLA